MRVYKTVWNRQSVSKALYKDRHTPWSLTYNKDTVVEADPESLGILCFETSKQARLFFPHMTSWDGIEVIQLEGIGDVTKPGKVADIHHLMQRGFKAPLTMSPPTGTICFQSVRVLE